MPEITKEGRYSLKIVDALFRETKDDGSFVVSLKLETEDGYYAWYDLLYTHAVIQSGRNAGLTTAQVSENLLIELGVEKGYLGDLVKKVKTKSLEAEAVMAWEEYNGKRRLRCKFLNPPRNKKTVPLADIDVEEVLAKFAAHGKDTQAKAEEEDKNNQIPF